MDLENHKSNLHGLPAAVDNDGEKAVQRDEPAASSLTAGKSGKIPPFEESWVMSAKKLLPHPGARYNTLLALEKIDLITIVHILETLKGTDALCKQGVLNKMVIPIEH